MYQLMVNVNKSIPENLEVAHYLRWGHTYEHTQT